MGKDDFRRRLGGRWLSDIVVASPESDPLKPWEDRLLAAAGLGAALRFTEAEAAASAAIEEFQRLPMMGPGKDRILALGHGLVGMLGFQSGSTQRGIELTSKALDICRTIPDGEGIVVYLESLYDQHRYAGQFERAAVMAEDLAAQLLLQGQHAKAAWFRQQAALTRKGAPLNRIVARVGNDLFEPDDAPQLTEGKVEFVFERNRPTLQSTTVLVERAIALVLERRMDEALEVLREAGERDPHSPDPPLKEGFAFLLRGEYLEALERFKKTEELAPGWYHCRSYLWLAEQAAEKGWRPEIFHALGILDDDGQPDELKIQLGQAMIAKHVDLARLRWRLAKSLLHAGRFEESDRHCRAGLSLAMDADSRTCLLVQLAAVVPETEERRKLLEEAVELNGNLVVGAQAKLLLHLLTAGTWVPPSVHAEGARSNASTVGAPEAPGATASPAGRSGIPTKLRPFICLPLAIASIIGLAFLIPWPWKSAPLLIVLLLVCVWVRAFASRSRHHRLLR